MAGLDKISEERLRSAFRKADHENRGTIDKKSFSIVLRNLGQEVQEETVKDLLTRSGIDQSPDEITYGMFTTLTRRLAKEQRQEMWLRRVFREFDMDSKGYIDTHNIKRVLTKYHIEHTEGEVELMMDAADTNGDGRVDYDEFMEIFTRPPATTLF